ncbi:hypothetical protein BD410DRAFT_697070, partial [Rickenella mellea]
SAKGLPSTGRPAELANWCKRKNAAEPTITDASAFGTQWRKYYTSLQPVGRDTDVWPLSKIKADGVDWSPLLQGGRKGIYSLLISLSWWQKAATTRKERLLVEESVKDAHWV